MERKNFVNIQKDIANERIEVIEGVFIGTIIGLILLAIVGCCMLF